MTLQPWLRQAFVLSASAGGLAALGAHPGPVLSELRHPHAWVARVGADAAAAQLAGVLAWCLLALLLAALVVASALALTARLPGQVGAVADRLAAVAVPAVVRRLLGVGVGAGLALAVAPAAHAATPAGAGSSSRHAPDAAAIRVLPTPVLPAHGIGELPTAPMLPVVHEVPTALGDHRDPARPGSIDAHGAGATTYVVRPGDSLWRIAQRCHPEASEEAVSAAWPAWYETNRDVIGADPAAVRPGQALRVPGSSCTDPMQ